VKTGVRLGAIVLIGTFATGCASQVPDARALQDQLVAVGVAPAAARCLVRQMRKDFTDVRLGAQEHPTDEEIALQRELARECGVKLKKG
jgi:hypothetical protein